LIVVSLITVLVFQIVAVNYTNLESSWPISDVSHIEMDISLTFNEYSYVQPDTSISELDVSYVAPAYSPVRSPIDEMWRSRT